MLNEEISKVGRLEKVVGEVGNYLKLMNSVIKQDLKDRHGVSLLGLKTDLSKQESLQAQREIFDKGQYQTSSIKIAEKCLSCSSYQGQNFRTFKIACLAYRPTAVKLDDKIYSREQIEEKQDACIE